MKRLISLTCVLALTVSAMAGEKRVEDYLPADALVTVCYYGDNPELRETALAKLLAEPEVSAWLTSVRQLIAGGNQLAAQFMKVNAGYLLPLLNSQVGISVSFGMGPIPDVLAVAKVGEDGAMGRRSVDAFLKQIEAVMLRGGAAPKMNLGDIDVTQLGQGPGSVSYGYRDGFLFLSTSGPALEKALAAGTPKLSASPAFQRMAALKGTPVGSFTYNHKQLMAKFGAMMPPPALATLQTLGLDGADVLGVRLTARGRALVGGAWVQVTGERRGLLKALSAGPLDRSLLKLIPRDASVAVAMNIDAAQMYEVLIGVIHTLSTSFGGPDIRGEMAAFEVDANVDLAADVFGNLTPGTVMTSAGASLLPALILSQGAKDAAKFEAAMAGLVKQLDVFVKNAGGQGKAAELRAIAYGEYTIRYVALPGVPVPLAPCFAQAGGRMVFALTPVHLKDYLTYLDSQGPSILDAPGFQKLAASIPEEASLISYSRAGEDFLAMYEVLGPLLTIVQGIPNNPIPVDLANLPSTATLRKHLFDSVSYVVAKDGMLLYECESPFGFEIVGPVPALAALTMGPALLLPALARARGQARAVQAMNNQRQITVAAMMYVQDKGTYPKSLSDLLDGGILENRAILVDARDANPPALANGVPCSYESVFDRHQDRVFSRDFPPNRMILWDRRPFRRGMRAVSFADGHVERMREGPFRQKLTELDAFVKANVKKRKQGGEL